MTDNEAYRIAVECIQAAMKPITFEANIGRLDPKNAPASALKKHERYKQLAAALMILEGKAKQRRMIP